MHTLLTGFHQHLLWIGQFVLIYVYLPRVHNKERSWPVAYVECTCMQRVMWLGCQFSSYKIVHWLKIHVTTTFQARDSPHTLNTGYRPVWYSLLFCNIILLTLLHVHVYSDAVLTTTPSLLCLQLGQLTIASHSQDQRISCQWLMRRGLPLPLLMLPRVLNLLAIQALVRTLVPLQYPLVSRRPQPFFLKYTQSLVS